MTATEIRTRPSPMATGRLLRLELRRNAMIWMLPLLAAVFGLVTYKAVMGYAAVWQLRALIMLNHLLADFVPFAAGVAAWMGSRETRRHTTDMVTAAARPGWARQGATFAATACWVLLAYLGCVAVLYGMTATQVTWGGPPLWPVAVGAAYVIAACALGFAVGVLLPSRFTAPLAAVGALLLALIGMRYAVNATGGADLLSPVTGVPPFDVGVFRPYPPDLSIAQVMFLAGLSIAAVSVIGVPAATGGGRLLRLSAATLTVAGLASAGTAIGLTSSAYLGSYGVVIPALHDAASNRPIPYTPICNHTLSIPICVHPAFRAYLPDATAALDPVLTQVTGLPGAPVRVTQAATIFQANQTNQPVTQLTGTPPVLNLYLASLPLPTGPWASDHLQQIQLGFLHAFVGATGTSLGTPAQQAVQAALLQTAGVPLAAQPEVIYQAPWTSLTKPGTATGPIYTAARRFSTLPATTRRAWLTTHLPALRSGQLTPADLP